jgi:hypothetical protein
VAQGEGPEFKPQYLKKLFYPQTHPDHVTKMQPPNTPPPGSLILGPGTKPWYLQFPIPLEHPKAVQYCSDAWESRPEVHHSLCAFRV